MLCKKKHEGKVRNTIGGKQHPMFLLIRICFFSWTVFLFLPRRVMTEDVNAGGKETFKDQKKRT